MLWFLYEAYGYTSNLGTALAITALELVC